MKFTSISIFLLCLVLFASCLYAQEKIDFVTKGPGCKTPSFLDIKSAQDLTLRLLIVAAAIDAVIEPCAQAVLVLLLGALLVARKRERLLHGGLAFTGAIFISYYLMGQGIYSAIKLSGVTTQWLYRIIAFFAVSIGLFNIKSFLWYKRGPNPEVPQSWRPKLKKVIGGVTSIPGVFFTGVLVSLFLAPCTSGPYFVVLGLLADKATRATASWMLLLYNSIFILPLVIITLLIHKRITTTARAERWRQRNIRLIHLISGLIMLGIGIAIMR